MDGLKENKIYDKLKINGVCFKNVRVVITNYSLEIFKNDKFISNIPIDCINKIKECKND